jgi:hypothetical protein
MPARQGHERATTMFILTVMPPALVAAGGVRVRVEF